MFETLEGTAIRLRKAREADSGAMLKNVWGDPEVYRWMLFQPTLTPEDALERCRRSILFQRDSFAYFATLKDSDEAVGFCGIRENGPGHFEETGICVGTRYQGKGYGREILSLLLELAFEKLDAADFRYGAFRENVRSKKLAERFGFRFDHSEELVRPWDGAKKTVDSYLLTREDYLSGTRAPLAPGP